MEDHVQHPHPALETAWKRYAEMDFDATKKGEQFLALRRLAVFLGVVAIIFAILVDAYVVKQNVFYPAAEYVLIGLLILLPIGIALLAAFGNNFFNRSTAHILRDGADEILKEIYLYRTVFKYNIERHKRLTERVVQIQRHVYQESGGQLPQRQPAVNNPPTSHDYEDLDAGGYVHHRLDQEIEKHTALLQKTSQHQQVLRAAILATGAVAAVFAALSGSFTVWVAPVIGILSALIGWDQLRNLESTRTSASRVIANLTIARDRWNALTPEERDLPAFMRLVIQAEAAISGHNPDSLLSLPDTFSAPVKPPLPHSPTPPEPAMVIPSGFEDEIFDNEGVTPDVQDVFDDERLAITSITQKREKKPRASKAITENEGELTKISRKTAKKLPEEKPAAIFEDEIFDDEALDPDVKDVFGDETLYTKKSQAGEG